MVAELVINHTENLSKPLQNVSMSAAEGQQVVSMTVAIIISKRNGKHLKLSGI